MTNTQETKRTLQSAIKSRMSAIKILVIQT